MKGADPVADALPPEALLRILNPIMVRFLEGSLGRLVGALALLEFTGRRSGRRYRVPVGWHEVGGQSFVLTPAGWRTNFIGGIDVLVVRCGRTHRMTGTLDDDADETARLVREALASGTRDRMLGMQVTKGHRVTSDDMRRLNRQLVRLT